jgi:hypothetical protein
MFWTVKAAQNLELISRVSNLLSLVAVTTFQPCSLVMINHTGWWPSLPKALFGKVSLFALNMTSP